MSQSTPQFGEEIAHKYRSGLKSEFTSDLEHRLERLGDRRLRSLVRRVVDDDASQKKCKLLQEKENYRIYEVNTQDDEESDEGSRPEASSSTSTGGLVTMKGVLLLQSSSCEEVMELLSTSVYSDLFGAMYADSTVLHESPVSMQSGGQSSSSASRDSTMSATPVSSSLSIHWLMLKDLSALLPSRDFVFMRYNQLYASDDPGMSQRIGWGASILESVQLKSCAPLWSASVSRRSALTKCGFIVEASDHSDATRVTFFVTASNTQDRQWLMKVAASVRHIPSAIVNHRIRYNKLIDKREWVLRDTCGLCTQSFSKLLKRRHHCRLCGVSVCSKCTQMRANNTIRVCLSCVNGEDTSALWGKVSMARKKLGNSITSSSITSSAVSSSWDPVSTHLHNKESWSSSLSMDQSMQNSFDYSAPGSVSYVRGSALEEFLDSDPMSKSKLSSSSMSIGSMSISSTTSSVSVDEDDIFDNSPCDYQLSYAKGNPWPDAPVPKSEAQRLQRIKTLNLSAQYAKENLKELLDLARTSVNCPVAAVGVVSVSTILLVTAVGLAGDQLPRDVGFEAHTIMSAKPLVVLDSQKDERFAMNPLVSSMNIRFYVGVPLVTKDGIVVGALSLGDKSPREKVNGSDLRSLQRLAARIVAKMDAGNEAKPSKVRVSGVLLI